jgi:hypothetical protein
LSVKKFRNEKLDLYILLSDLAEQRGFSIQKGDWRGPDLQPLGS